MKSFSFLLWIVFSVTALLFSIGVSWQIHKANNFCYPMWYQALEIKSHINEYAPQNNHNKQDFNETSSKEHFRLFARINQAIHNNGNGLANISYMPKQSISNSNKPNSKQLLTNDEVIHLQDVANLIDKLTIFWCYSSSVLFLSAGIIYWKKAPPPNVKHQWLLFLFVTSACVIVLLSVGFTKIFYWLHEIVFPENHQWFFYYQDSLMSTLMKAPDLFSVIAASILCVAIGLFWLLQHTFYRRFNCSV